jgi:hypothetical protein
LKIQDLLKLYPDINKKVYKLEQDNALALMAKLNNDGCIKSSIISDLPRGGLNSDPTYRNTERLLDNLEEISLELNDMAEYTLIEIRRLNDLKKQIDNAWIYLTSRERMIIELRYWDYPEPKYNWNKVVIESYYSRRECFRINDEALIKISRFVNMALIGTMDVIN